jgi:hypothetical protein
MNWEGEAPAEPKRQRVANSEWRMVFLEGTALPCRKNFGRAGTKLEGCSPEQPNLFSVVREHDPPVKAKNGSDEWRIANGEQRVASSFVWQCSCIAENFGLTTALRTSHPNWAHQKVRPPKNLSANREVGKSASRETAAIGE